MNIDPEYYRKTSEGIWTGRNDGPDADVQRWHQRIIPIDLAVSNLPLLKNDQKGIAIIGFCCDEGVIRNGGRPGAKSAPLEFRKASGTLPVHFDESIIFVDLGDIICENGEMENAQSALADLVKITLQSGYQPLLIGGGHEIVYGHYNGISSYLGSSATIGIINFDAHFDLRDYNKNQNNLNTTNSSSDINSSNSGTGFLQIADDCREAQQKFHYLPIGIQHNSNTKRLLDKAADLDVKYITTEQFSSLNHKQVTATIRQFIEEASAIYLTIDMDVFSSAVAPGVSATAWNGIFPDSFFFHCLQIILDSRKLISTDISEFNPVYDTEKRTAKLTAALAFKIISRRSAI